MEKTLVMIKPDGIEAKMVGLLISDIEYSDDLTITRMKQKVLSLFEAEDLYAEHKGKDFFERNLKHVTSGPVIIIEIEGYESVTKCRTIIEDFRHRFKSLIELPKNLFHATSSPDKASDELKAVFGQT